MLCCLDKYYEHIYVGVTVTRSIRRSVVYSLNSQTIPIHLLQYNTGRGSSCIINIFLLVPPPDPLDVTLRITFIPVFCPLRVDDTTMAQESHKY